MRRLPGMYDSRTEAALNLTGVFFMLGVAVLLLIGSMPEEVRGPPEGPLWVYPDGLQAPVAPPLEGFDLASALAYEYGERLGVPPLLVLGVILTENPWLDPEAVSSHGSVGLMQVTPRFWLGMFPACGTDLTVPRTNVCYGTSILALLLARYDRTEALLRYNGCRGAYLQRRPQCLSYPDTVEARGGL